MRRFHSGRREPVPGFGKSPANSRQDAQAAGESGDLRAMESVFAQGILYTEGGT